MLVWTQLKLWQGKVQTHTNSSSFTKIKYHTFSKNIFSRNGPKSEQAELKVCQPKPNSKCKKLVQPNTNCNNPYSKSSWRRTTFNSTFHIFIVSAIHSPKVEGPYACLVFLFFVEQGQKNNLWKKRKMLGPSSVSLTGFTFIMTLACIFMLHSVIP